MALRMYGTIAVAVISGLITVVGLSASTFYYFTAAHDSKISERTVTFLFRVGILRAVIGTIGLAASFASVSSLLSIIGGFVAFTTMKNLALAVALSKSPSCVKPVLSANLALVAIFFAFVELIAFVVINISTLPSFFVGERSCTLVEVISNQCSYAYSDSYMQSM